MRARRWRRPDTGSVLMLVPVGILVLLVLASIAVDAAIVHGAQRDLANRTAAAAGDIANAALDDAALYGESRVVLDDAVAAAYTQSVFAPERRPAGYEHWSAEVATDGRRVTVAAAAEVRYLFSPAIPGAPRTATVRATSTAESRG